jgi:hypothetical protein
VPLNVPEGDLYVIRVARSGTYNGVTVEAFEKEFLMEGGYADCGSALPDTNNDTVIDDGGANTQVVDVRNTIERKRVTLANLTIQNSSRLTASGLYVSGTDINLRNVTIQNVTGPTTRPRRAAASPAGPFDPGAFEGNDRLFRDAFDAF